jgi:hypothetical protein
MYRWRESNPQIIAPETIAYTSSATSAFMRSGEHKHGLCVSWSIFLYGWRELNPQITASRTVAYTNSATSASRPFGGNRTHKPSLAYVPKTYVSANSTTKGGIGSQTYIGLLYPVGDILAITDIFLSKPANPCVPCWIRTNDPHPVKVMF